jgi:ABC-2 type transport system permease protein
MPRHTIIYRLFRVELQILLREPAAVFFSLLFPAILAVITDAAFGHEHAVGGYSVADVNVASILAIALANIGVMSVPIVIAEYKDRAILKRYHTSPISMGWLLAVLAAISLIIFVAAAFLVILVTKIGFGLHLGGSLLAVLGLSLFAGVAFTAVGFMLGGWLRSPRTAQAVGSLLFFPVIFLSGAIIPVSRFPHALQTVSHAIPVRYLVNGLSYLWVGHSSPQVWQAFVAMAATGAIASLIAWRTFRWM